MDQVAVRAVERAVDTMRRNFGDRLTIDDLARSAMFSKFHFTRVFQRVTGLSPGRFLSAVRLAEAKRLLVSTSLTVADISHQVGYNSVGTFSSRFRNSVGVSPTTYRQLGGVAGHVPTAETPVTPTRATVRGHIVLPQGRTLGPVFVGLFPGRILEAPAVRHTMLAEPGPYAVTDVPAGRWYLLAYCGPRRTESIEIPPHVGSSGPIDISPDITARLADIRMRPLHMLDPPILMALQDVRPAAAQAAS